MFNCNDKTCECCSYLFINGHYTFNAQVTFKLKTWLTCDNFNFIYVVIFDKWKEWYIIEIEKGKAKLKDRVGMCCQHIEQPKYQQLKVEDNLRECGNR